MIFTWHYAFGVNLCDDQVLIKNDAINDEWRPRAARFITEMVVCNFLLCFSIAGYE